MKLIVFDVESMMHLFVLSVLEIGKDTPQSLTTPKAAYDYIRSTCGALWVGYNSNAYDDYLIDMIIKTEGNCTPEELRELSDDIINREKKLPWKSFLSYDVFDPIEVGMRSLKMYCGSMGNSTYDSPYSFMEDRFYNENEIKSIVAYCEQDVIYTAQIFEREKPFFDASFARIGIMEDAGYEVSDKEVNRFACCRAASFARAVFEKLSPNRDEADDFRTTIKFIAPYSNSSFEEVRRAFDFYNAIVKGADEDTPDAQFYKAFVTPNFEDFQEGLTLSLGFGGIHGALDGYLFDKELNKGKCVLYGDVTSMYPTFMINHDLYPHTFTEESRELYEMAYKGRIHYKASGDIAKSAACKRILNSLTGMLKDPYAKFRAPWANNSITINGQLSLLDLACRLKETGLFKIIQVNTDGIMVEADDRDESRKVFRTLLNDWEGEYKCSIKMKEVERLIQTDVNNYAMLEIGETEYTRKGAAYNFNEIYFRDKVIVKRLLPDAILGNMIQLEPIVDMVNHALDSSEGIEDFFILIKVTDTFPYLKEEISGRLIESRCVRCIAAKGDDISRSIADEEALEYVRYIKVRGNKEQSAAVSLFPDIAIELPAEMSLYDKTSLKYLIDVDYYARLIQKAVWNFYNYSEPKVRKPRKSTTRQQED